MKIKPRLTSQFGDYRTGHWHAGIDLSTRGKTGYKIYAIADGYLYRVRTSFWGYGKALYLKLSDGRYAVYGHLQRFSPQIEEKIRRIQMKDRKYFQDIYLMPGKFRVRKGDYIALSGQTGSGSPHLHLEIRDENNVPVNPLKGFYNLPDRIPPKVDYLVLKRYNSYGFLGYHDTEFLPLSGKSPNYSVADTINIYNQAVFEVSAYDPNRGYNYGLYGASVTLDDSLIFSFEHNELDYSTGNQIDYVRNHRLKRLVENHNGIMADNDKNVFYRLYIQPDDIQLFYNDFKYPAGIIDADYLKPGVYELILSLYDINNNHCRVKLYLQKASLDEPEIYDVAGDSIYRTLCLEDIPSDNEPHVQMRKALYLPYETIPVYVDMAEGTVKFLIVNDAYDYRVRVIDRYANSSPWIVFNPQADSQSIILFSDYLETIIPENGSALINELLLSDLGILPLNNLYKKVLIPVPEYDGYFDPEIVSIPYGEGYYIFHTKGTAYSPDSTVKVEISDNKLYGKTIMQISEPEPDVFGGYIFDILPRELLFQDDVEILVEPERLALRISQSSLYYYSDKKDKWFFIGKKHPGYLAGETMGGGRFGIFVDTTPPDITTVRPKNKRKYKDSTPLLSCKITDNLSGFNKETQFAMTVDGVWVPALYDIDTKTFSYQVRNKLKKGNHTLKITAVDNQGNRSVAVSRFTLTSGR